jgi:hypothetical protein
MYSPDLNPIEMPYGKFKAHIRKLAERTGEGVRRSIRSFLPSLGGRECAKLFQACRLCFHMTGTHSSCQSDNKRQPRGYDKEGGRAGVRLRKVCDTVHDPLSRTRTKPGTGST